MENVTINDKEYKYEPYYQRLELVEGQEDNAEIACPKCHNTSFKIKYGNYKCIATCSCGHSMTVYDG